MSVTNLESSAPTLQLHPSARRNLLGGHGTPPTVAGQDEELPRELLHAALKDAAHLGYEQLVVAGGEPFLYDGLPGLLARARRLDYVTTVVTNGTLIGQLRRWAPVAPLIDLLTVEIHGTEVEHDRLVRRDGAYAQTIANLAVVRGSGVPFGFLFTLTPSNTGSLEHVVRLAAAEGARSVEVRPRPLVGEDGAAVGGAVDPADALLGAAAIAQAQALGTELGVRVRGCAVTQDELVLYRGRFVPQFPTREVTALAPVLLIESSGWVRPLCAEVPDRLILGSIRRHRLGPLATAWVASRRAADLAAACDRTWWDLAGPGAAPAVHWYDELALRLSVAEAVEALPAAA